MTRGIASHSLNLIRFRIDRHKYNRCLPIKLANQVRGRNPIHSKHASAVIVSSQKNTFKVNLTVSHCRIDLKSEVDLSL